MAERAERLGDRGSALLALIERDFVRLHGGSEVPIEAMAAQIDEALPLLEEKGDDFALFMGAFAVARLEHYRGRMDAALTAASRAHEHARRSGAAHRELRVMPMIRSGKDFGTTPVLEELAWLESIEPAGATVILAHRSRCLAMVGRFDEARAIIKGVLDELSDQRAEIPYALALVDGMEIERFAGDWEAAAHHGLDSCQRLRDLGERAWLSTLAAQTALALCALGRLDEAAELVQEAFATGAEDDVVTQILGRQAQGRILALRGDFAEGERLAREAVALVEATDLLDTKGDALADLAEVLALAGRTSEAVESFRLAAERFERKGNLVSAGRVRLRLEELESG